MSMMGVTIETSPRCAHSPLILSRAKNNRLEAEGWAYVSKRDSSDIERAPIGVEHSLLHHLGQRRMWEDGMDEFLLGRL